MFTLDQIRLFESIDEMSNRLNMPAYVVGGTVRDLLLGGDPADKDIDFVIVGDAVQFAKSAEQEYSGMLRIFPAFLTAKIISPALFSTISEVDFATSRKEIYTSPGKLPEVTPAPIADDLKRRDFTINAMAIPVAALLRWGAENFGDPAKLAAETMDLFAGRSDLEKRIIRILHEGSFIDDPTRIFRGCRYAVRISGKFDPTSVQRIAQAIRGGAFGTISPQRIMNEIKKIFFERRTAEVLEVLDSLNGLEPLNLYERSSHASVISELHTLDDMGVPSDEVKFSVGLRLLMQACNKEGRVERFSKFGIRVRDLKQIETELAGGTKGAEEFLKLAQVASK